ncbi:hypothetical protein Syun_025370 [Stephania yunnanensis]|uniref:Uncharacterized protein n=1 Tax=Stephania yunnanensis TaxID=152371 RepID=A0AAP0HW56_9MAGN
MAETRAQAVCAKEALELLNCATETLYDPQKCARLMNSLRDCVLKKTSYHAHFVVECTIYSGAGTRTALSRIRALHELKVKKFLLPEQSEPSQPESAQSTEEKSIS